jgi:hypothetical protein
MVVGTLFLIPEVVTSYRNLIVEKCLKDKNRLQKQKIQKYSVLRYHKATGILILFLIFKINIDTIGNVTPNS